MIDPPPDSDEPEDFEVLPENWTAVNLFLMLQTQWRMIAGMGGVIFQGIDYSAVNAALTLTNDPYPAYRFACLRLIERGALTVLNDNETS